MVAMRAITGLRKNVQEDNQHLQVDEAETARSAVAEGQAMVVFMDYTLRSSGKTLADSPEIGGQAEGFGGGYERVADAGAGSAAAAGVVAVSVQPMG